MKIALGVTGCIAAYKAIEVMRGLQRAGASVQVILTRAARRFVTPLTFEALSSQAVITGMFRHDENQRIQHIRVAQDAQLLAVVPATANILGKFAHGIADDSLTTIYLSCPAPVLVAPAMNVVMWNHPAVRANVEILKARGHHIVDPEPGDLACGMKGEGRLAGVETIVARILGLLSSGPSLNGIRILVTAGPTLEDLDAVRFISNRSSGKMGYALANAACARGAAVTLVTGPTSLPPPAGVETIAIRSAAEMNAAVQRRFESTEILIMAAAVADYRPAEIATGKIKKSRAAVSLALVPTEDVLEQLGRQKKQQVLVGFAAESDDLLENARAKLGRKNLDLIVANHIGSGVFGADAATVHILGASAEPTVFRDTSKTVIANRILDAALGIFAARRKRP